MESPKVSIIMNCLDGEVYLRPALESVFEQTYDDWEIIFWDNASTDKSTDIAESYGERVRCFKSSVTHSLGKARNLAIKEARGDFIAFLDCDDIWLPHKLEKQMSLFERDSEVALVFSDMFVYDGKNNVYQFLRGYKPPRGKVFRELFVNYFIGMVAVVIRKSALENLEWFDDRFENVEDMDLFLRISYSFKLDYVDEPLVKWRLHEQSRTFQQFSLFATEWELLLEKLINLDPNFKQEYSEEIVRYVSKTMQLKVMGEWLNRRPTQARELLKDSGFGKILRFSLFFITFLPPSIFFSLNKLRFRVRGLMG